MSVTLTFGEVAIEALSDRVTFSFPLTLLERQAANPANASTRRLVEMIREA